MKSKENTEIAATTTGFAELADTNFAALISGELDGLELSFERVKIPSGGATVYELPTESDDTESVKEFSAVILDHHPLNAYYVQKYTGGSNPPNCGSFDGKTGEGDPGGNCAKCPKNQFGSAENGAKACKNKRRVYILREGEMFPMLLTLPTGSLKAFTKYLMTQLSKGRASNAVVTRFALKKMTSNTGVVYSQAIFSFDRALSPEEYALVKPFSEQIKAYASRVGFDADSSVDDEVIVDSDSGAIIEPLGGSRNV